MTGPLAEPTRADYTAWLNEKVDPPGGAPTPPLQEFAYWWEFDSNLAWRIDTGHLVNLLEAAITQIEELNDELQTIQVGGEYQRGYDHATAAHTNEILQLREQLRVARQSPQEDTGATGASENA